MCVPITFFILMDNLQVLNGPTLQVSLLFSYTHHIQQWLEMVYKNILMSLITVDIQHWIFISIKQMFALYIHFKNKIHIVIPTGFQLE